jgi:hypothetical protein
MELPIVALLDRLPAVEALDVCFGEWHTYGVSKPGERRSSQQQHNEQ